MSKTAAPLTPVEARMRSDNARARLLSTLGQVQEKMNPLTLAQDAVESVAVGVMRDTVATVRARPRTMAAAAGLAMLFMVRKPIARWVWRGARHATATGAASLKATSQSRSIKGSNT